MLALFEVVVAPSHDPAELLSEEVLRETQAQMMTIEEASAVGFSGMQPDPKGREIRLIAVAPRDVSFVQRRLETSPAAQAFRVHEVDV